MIPLLEHPGAIQRNVSTDRWPLRGTHGPSGGGVEEHANVGEIQYAQAQISTFTAAVLLRQIKI